MAKNVSVKVTTPKGELQWVYITGEGRKNKQGTAKYQASLVLPTKEAKEFTDQIDAFWKDNKPAGAKKPTTCGYRPHTMKSSETDEDGDPIYKEVPGMTEIFFATGTEWPDGKKKVIRIYNSKANLVALGEKRIGNGTIGQLSGNMCVYDVSGNQGINLYLEAVKISKFVEYTGGDNFDEDDGEEGWTGEDDDSWSETSAADAPKPRL